MATNGLRTAGAPGEHLAGTGVQRLERRPACQPWGSTLTFQRNAGVSWVHGLRHGVAMHPRGRHLREGMILLFTWRSHTQAREKQPPHKQQPQHYYYKEVWNRSEPQPWMQCRERIAKKKRENDSGSGIHEPVTIREGGACATTHLSAGPSRPTSCRKRTVKPRERKEVTIVCWAVSPHQSEVPGRQNRQSSEEGNAVRRQPGELYYIYRDDAGVNVKVGWAPTGHRVIWFHRITIGVFRR